MSKRKLPIVVLSTVLLATGVAAMNQSDLFVKNEREQPVAAPASAAAAEPRRAPVPAQAPAERLMSRWSSYVERVYGTAPEDWRRAMRPTLSRLSEKDLRRAADMPSFDLMMAALAVQPAAPAIAISQEARLRKAAPLLEADAAQLAYNMVAPCRLVDTRNVNARLAPGGVLHLNSAGGDLSGQGGNSSGCGIPADAGALVLNVTAVDPGNAGYLTVFPYGGSMPVASSLNYVAQSTAGNEIIAKQALGQPATVSIYSYAASDVVVDVVGYFSQALPNSLLCWNEVGVAELPPGNYGAFPVYCPSVFQAPDRSTVVGGSCRWVQNGVDDEAPGQLSGYPGSGGYSCSGDNLTSAYRQYEITAICCRVVPQGVN